MNNMKVRIAMIERDIKQWQLAELLGVSEATTSRMFRKEMPAEEQNRIVQLIEKGIK